MTYPKASAGAAAAKLTASPDFPRIEEEVLAYWKTDGTFQASIDNRPAGANGENEFVFYDGPPFANGLPHYGHLLTGYAKDVIPRYQTLRGRRVERRFGWDTHGLPAELEAQRVLGLKTKADILALGIEKFNEACRTSVLKYTGEWQAYVTRQARWVDFENDYKTLNRDYMESVIWAFKTLYDKGLVYEGLRVLPYCWNDETPLSNHELRMDDDVYQPRQDPSVTVAVTLETGERLLAWTTTPWTLPSNLAMAVGPDLDYVVVEDAEGRPSILAGARLDAYATEFGADARERITRRLKGSELIGLRYTPLFPFFADTELWGTENAFQVIAADHVTTENGSGVVHMAPAYGEEDQAACDAVGIPTLLTVDEGARFTSVVAPYEGLFVFEANRPIINDLKAAGVLVHEESYVHSYPHCWRCRNPLIYKAVSSWFVEVTRIRDRMVELNEQITWVPEHVKHGQFGKWLSNARDWSISRNRFWGSPIPVWRSDDPAYPRIDVYGSVAELERDFGVPVADLHRPFIDDLTRPNPDDPTGRSTMRRVPDVLDVWFDSGSMSFAQVHYPFENTDWFEHHFPGDFIVEYIGQTRGWFYTMHILATALFDRPAFSSCVSHGIVLGSDGQKMSKSLRNYPDVSAVFERDGADAMRWFLMSSPILRGGNLMVTEQGIREGVRQVMIPLWNAWYFFALYANAANGGTGYDATWSTGSEVLLDRYLLAKTRAFVEDIQGRLDALEISAACESVAAYLEVLTNWYIRRSRERFWDDGDVSFGDAANTLYTALEVATRAISPLLPLAAEEVWRGLTGGRSVHLTDWPDVTDLPSDPALVAQMDRIREVCSVTSAVRKSTGIRGRQPLCKLTVATTDAKALKPLTSIVAAEANVQEVVLVDLADVDDEHAPVSQKLTVNARAAGPRLGRDVQSVIKAAKSGDWSVDDAGVVTAGGIDLQEGEYTLETTLADHNGTEDAAAGESRASGLLGDGGFVVLDTAITPELAAEGVARDVIRAVQQARRDAGLDITDRIRIRLATDDEDVRQAVETHRALIMNETLALAIDEVAAAESSDPVQVGDGQSLQIRIEKA
ncbi:isoleucine--tRNA ligase [Kribbella sp. VKM Ac-2568]|uniref:isoleucine--tRNA ligase n=1 Tax=Kribbella sp. VKM Ac-2568 TaxID=2512219 RepID=UPI00104EDD27|nr:isoleucine--tRNA ligase [Kribbella sp. VKM Ac-2568]TCM51891.1 isoleucyl-tRNA synthetase [Kribbella sp. VKM Ac-2568]